jgi:hypothetical protein
MLALRFWLLTSLAVACISSAQAATQTGRQFWAMCKGQAAGEFCGGYVEGVFDSILEQATDCQFFFPGGTDSDQIYDVVMKYLREFPENRGWPMSEIVEVALKQSFPCK